MKLALFALTLLSATTALAIESGATTLRCDDASGDVNGIYISYGYDWINDGTSTTTVDFTGYGTAGKRFVVTTTEPSDPRALPAGVVANVSLESASGSRDNNERPTPRTGNKVELSYKGDQYEFTLTVRPQDIHRDAFKGQDEGNWTASYSFPAEAVMTGTGDHGMNPPVRAKMKCRAKSGMAGMAG